jgi:hypothetical protein
MRYQLRLLLIGLYPVELPPKTFLALHIYEDVQSIVYNGSLQLSYPHYNIDVSLLDIPMFSLRFRTILSRISRGSHPLKFLFWVIPNLVPLANPFCTGLFAAFGCSQSFVWSCPFGHPPERATPHREYAGYGSSESLFLLGASGICPNGQLHTETHCSRSLREVNGGPNSVRDLPFLPGEYCGYSYP